MFEKDEYVFYESGGICRISDIQVAPLEGMPADRTYYVMRSVHDRNGVIYIPVDNDRVFLRRLLNREEAQRLIESIPTVETIEEPNAKSLRTRYLDAMRMHTPVEWVRIIKTVYRRSRTEDGRAVRLSETERSLSESAKRYLYTELALALDTSESEMERYVAACIEKMA